MLAFRLSLCGSQRSALKLRLKSAQRLGNLKLVKRVLAILSLADGASVEEVASVLRVCEESVIAWLRAFLEDGIAGLKIGKSPGRPPKLTKSQKKELASLIDAGPQASGFAGDCWRSPMIQELILEKFQVYYSVHYLSQLLNNLGFSYQKARFVSDHLDAEKRKEWIEKTWPEILKKAKQTGAYLLFGDEASFPQWGTLSYTWARKGQQPQVKTSGKRKAIKVFGLIDYFSGRLFYKAIEGKLNSDSYQEFLKEVLSRTRKPIILIQDAARYHRSKATREFIAKNEDRLSVYEMPAYWPDYNPIEKLWKKIKQKYTHLHYFESFEALVNKVEEAMLGFANAPKEVMSLFGFYEELVAA